MPNRIYTEKMGQPPKDIDMGSSMPSRPKIASGSKRGVSPEARAMDAMRSDDSMRHYKFGKNK
jgi:hypothetical protein